MVDFAVDPSRTALLVIDLQNCFVEGYALSVPDGPLILERLNRLADICRGVGMQIIHTTHILRADGSNIGIAAEIIAPQRDGILNEGEESAVLHKDLLVRPGDIVLNKPRFGAFYGTDLDLILRAKGIDTVIISGLTTNVCCETTAREANARDYKVHFLRDGTACFGTSEATKEEIQRVVCSTIGAIFGQVLTIDELVAKVSATVAV